MKTLVHIIRCLNLVIYLGLVFIGLGIKHIFSNHLSFWGVTLLMDKVFYFGLIEVFIGVVILVFGIRDFISGYDEKV